jgi:ribosomal protein S18 acetylase RimI-like enzyme
MNKSYTYLIAETHEWRGTGSIVELMNVLIDTNIVIPLEDTNRELSDSFATMKRLCGEKGVVLKKHPSQFEDIARDQDDNRRKIVLSRMKQYPSIPNPPSWSEEELNKFGLTFANDNDKVDNHLLCALYRNSVHLLVTEDRGIHRKAARLGIQERVHYLAQFIVFLKNKDGTETTPPLGIRNCYLHELRVENHFFDSLRAAYSGFDDWFAKCCRQNRAGWVIQVDNDIMALVIKKIEHDETVTIDGFRLNGTALKLCTFKVSPQWRGRKIGERLLHTAFKFALENKIDWIYLTAFGDEQKMLITLCEEFGFERKGFGKNRRDEVYCKDMRKPEAQTNLSCLEFAIKYFPFYRKDLSNKWIVPIRPQFHNMLFPDISDYTNDLFKDDPNTYSSFSNTIKKAYLCHSNVKKLSTGDILYFYRSKDRKSVECVGIVEDVFRSSNVQDVLAAVSKRTVYNQAAIKAMATREILVILFRLLEYIPPVDYNELAQKGIIGNIQSIRKFNEVL